MWQRLPEVLRQFLNEKFEFTWRSSSSSSTGPGSYAYFAKETDIIASLPPGPGQTNREADVMRLMWEFQELLMSECPGLQDVIRRHKKANSITPMEETALARLYCPSLSTKAVKYDDAMELLGELTQEIKALAPDGVTVTVLQPTIRDPAVDYSLQRTPTLLRVKDKDAKRMQYVHGRQARTSLHNMRKLTVPEQQSLSMTVPLVTAPPHTYAALASKFIISCYLFHC
jgi:hypothetical protein